MDKLTPQQRHKTMAAIRGKNTKPEMIVRRGLWKRGFRYRLNHKRLPGHPDLVLRKYRTCIFVNGCFWHGHNVTESQVQGSGFKVQDSPCCKIPKTNREFWVAKIRRNKERDKEEQKKLLPKLHGSRKKLEPVLGRLWKLCFTGAGKDLNIAQEHVEKAQFKESADKIRRMYESATANGFTSFAEA